MQERAQEPPPVPQADNDICPVMGQKVGEKSPTATVRGRAYRICCAPCAQKLEKSPDKYLDADGAPKNAKKQHSHAHAH
jgi:YHS domain-containing protein